MIYQAQPSGKSRGDSAIIRRGNMVHVVYCPSKHQITKDQFKERSDTLSDKFITRGHFTAEKSRWGSRIINSKSRELQKALVTSGYRTDNYDLPFDHSPIIVKFTTVTLNQGKKQAFYNKYMDWK
ncbi:PREDICTED: uncharacterized protein LOC108553458 [Eufriesea mexicana]|uniref:uncharacterized protein LOC108553458 n=1 Tax=Eufriesea mexicana TaxID=516756 RepID=UPI00083C7FDA|nr:PREDICTED: uncharacterized protein LOC108553458 [Eufriesea mexicana]